MDVINRFLSLWVVPQNMEASIVIYNLRFHTFRVNFVH
jgi:hypothetical protein